MIRTILVLCLFINLAYETHGAVAIIPADPHYSGGCNSTSTGEMKHGMIQPYGKCGQATCNRGGTISLESCGVVSGCTLVEDLSKPYPKCCKTCKTP